MAHAAAGLREARNIVDLIRDDAAKAIKTHKLRGNVSILEGSGGNIAVLTAADGKLFVDAGITASRPRLLEVAKRYGPAHTDGDISVTFAEATTGGGIDGMIKATEANLAAATDRTIIIPGHDNPVSSRTELSAYRDMLVAIHDNVARLKHQGRSLEETIAAKPTARRAGHRRVGAADGRRQNLAWV